MLNAPLTHVLTMTSSYAVQSPYTVGITKLVTYSKLSKAESCCPNCKCNANCTAKFFLSASIHSQTSEEKYQGNVIHLIHLDISTSMKFRE